MANGLTDKQHVFLEEYLKCWNATEAARRAGYQGDDNTLGVVGWENLRKPNIAEYISKRLAARVMSTDEVLDRLSEQARASFADIITVNAHGRWKFDIEKIRQNGHLIKRIKETQWGLDVELYDAQSALSLIGKAHGMFVDRQEITGKDGDAIKVKAYTVVSPDDWDE